MQFRVNGCVADDTVEAPLVHLIVATMPVLSPRANFYFRAVGLGVGVENECSDVITNIQHNLLGSRAHIVHFCHIDLHPFSVSTLVSTGRRKRARGAYPPGSSRRSPYRVPMQRMPTERRNR